MTRGSSLVVAIALLCQTAPAVAETCSSRLTEETTRQMTAFLGETYPNGAGPGASVLVACRGETLYSYNAGMANIEWRQPISSTTSFRLGSISKPLVSVAVLQLVEEGAVGLDAPISTYVDRLPTYMRPVTVRQLLTHTSGLPDILLTPTLLPFARDWVSTRQIIDLQAKTPPRAEPGEAYDYSNFNYVLIAALLEGVSGRPFHEYVDTEVFEPLGMPRSHFDTRRAILEERAQGYETSPFGELLLSENIDMSHASAAGALLSSAQDLSRWGHLLMSGELLDHRTLEAAWSPQELPNGELSSYGLGFNVGTENGRRVIWHNGLASGFQAAFSLYPDEELTVVVLSNGFHLPNTTRAMDRVASLALAE